MKLEITSLNDVHVYFMHCNNKPVTIPYLNAKQSMHTHRPSLLEVLKIS